METLNQSQQPEPNSRKSHWLPVYCALCVFAVVAVSIGLGLNHFIGSKYAQSTEVNTFWTSCLNDVSTLESIAMRANSRLKKKPTDQQIAEFHADIESFHHSILQLNSAIMNSPASSDAVTLTVAESLEKARSNLTALREIGDQTFKARRKNPRAKVGRQWAAAGRNLADTTTNLRQVRGVLSEAFDVQLQSQSTSTSLIRKFEIGLAGLIGALVLGALYGYRLARMQSQSDNDVARLQRLVTTSSTDAKDSLPEQDVLDTEASAADAVETGTVTSDSSEEGESVDDWMARSLGKDSQVDSDVDSSTDPPSPVVPEALAVSPSDRDGLDNVSGGPDTESASEAEAADSLLVKQTVIDAACGVMITSASGTILHVNDLFCSFCEFSKEELIGQSRRILDSDYHNKIFYQKMANTISRGKSWQGEICHHSKTGTPFWAKTTAVPTKNAEGQVAEIQWLSYDVSEQRRIERDLHRNEERFNVAIQGSSDGLWDYTPAIDEVWYSNRFKELLGYRSNEFGSSFDEFVNRLHPDERNGVMQAIEDHLRDRVPYDAKYRLETKSGEYRWFRARGQALWDPAGNPVRMAGSITDINESMYNEMELDRSAKRATLLNQIIAIADAVDDFDEAIKRTVDLVCKMFGWTIGHAYIRSTEHEEELKPSNIWRIDDESIHAEFKEVTDRTTYRYGIGLPGRILKTQQAEWICDVQKDENFPRNILCDTLNVRAAVGFPITVGNQVEAVLEFFEETALDEDSSMLETLDSAGKQLGRVLERKLAAVSLRESEQRLMIALESAKAGLWDWDIHAGTFVTNDRFHHLIGEEPIQGPIPIDYLTERIHPEDLSLVTHQMEIAHADDACRYEVEFRFRCKDGSYKWIRSTGQVVGRNEAGEAQRMIGQHLDVTIQKLANEKVRAALSEAERSNKLMQGRETRIIELKEEVNVLRSQLDQEITYLTQDPEPLNIVVSEPAQKPEWTDTEGTVIENVVDRGLEKPDIDIAYMPTLCAAPLLYAKTRGLFAKNGLNVSLQPASAWSGIKDLLVYEHADLAHMLSPMPLAIQEGLDGKRVNLRLACNLNCNGQTLMLAKKYEKVSDIANMKGCTFGVPYRFSMQYYLLCQFLAQHGIDPVEDVDIIEVAPPRMAHFMETDRVDGVFCSEPINQVIIDREVGFAFQLSNQIWDGHPCCSLATTDAFVEKYPKTYDAIMQAVLEAESALHETPTEKRYALAMEFNHSSGLEAPGARAWSLAAIENFDVDAQHHLMAPEKTQFAPIPWPDQGYWILSQQQRWNQLRRKVDYQEIVSRCYDAQTEQRARSIGCVDAKPAPGPSDLLDPGDPFGYMEQQPFSRFSEQSDETELPSLSSRIEQLCDVLALASGGRDLPEIDAQADDAFGALERLVGDLHKNITFVQDALLEQNENLERRVDERIYEIEKNQRNALSIAEDADAARHEMSTARRQAEDLNKQLTEQIGYANEMTAEANKANQAKSEFLACMSHELRTPLNAVIGFSQGLLERVNRHPLNEHQQDRLGKIKSSGEHLLSLINDILDISKIESSGSEVSVSTIELTDLVREVETFAEGLLIKKDRVQFQVDIEDGLPMLSSDIEKIKQILINLVSNAIKFTNEGSVTFGITHRADTDTLLMSIKDTGFGIPEDEIENVFEKFYQVKNANTDSLKGTGLGLSLCQAFAERLGGEMSVKSELGVGSTFTLTIPNKLVEGDIQESMNLPDRSQVSPANSEHPSTEAKS